MNKPVDPHLQTMSDKLPKNTGKSLAEWFKLLKKKQVEKHGQIMNEFSKEESC